MVKELTHIRMAQSTEVSGLMINQMVLEKKIGLTKQNLGDSLIWESSKVMESFTGLMEVGKMK